MREIENNKPHSVNFQAIPPKTIQDESSEINSAVVQQQSNNINDLSALPSASLGQSQVSSSDSIAKDMKFFERNPELATAIIKAIDTYAQTHTDDETLQFLEKAHQELVNKK